MDSSSAKHDCTAPKILLYDVSFYEIFLVQHREVAREEVKLLTGTDLYFMCTNCTFDELLKKYHERDLAIPGWMGCYRCSDWKPVNEYECLKSLAARLEKSNNVILATDDALVYQLFKKIAHVPIVHLKNGELKFKKHVLYNAVTDESLTVQPDRARMVENEGAKKEQKKSHEEGLLAIAGEEAVPEIRANKNKLERKKNLKRLREEGSPAISGEEVWPEIRAKKRNKNTVNTGASSKENDEERIAQSFQQMYQKMRKAEKMTSYQAKANKPKISGNMQYFVVEHAYQPPFNVLFDNPFFQLYMLPNREIVVDNIRELLGDKFSFCHTNCVLCKIHQKSLLDFLLEFPHKEYRCRHDVAMVAKDFECLKEVILDNGLNDSLVLATGDSNFHSLMRRISPIPIIYLRDLDNLEACFEGQTASRRNIGVSKEKQNEGTSANPETAIKMENTALEISIEGDPAKKKQSTENDEDGIVQEMSKSEKMISKQQAKANKPKESLERKKTPAQKLIEEMSRIYSSLGGEGACEDKRAQKVKRELEEDEKADLQNNLYGKKILRQKGKRGQELEDFYDSHFF